MNHLSDAITLLNMKRSVSVVEQNNPDFTLIVPVDDAGTHLDTVLYGQTRATGDAGIASLRESSRESQWEPRTSCPHGPRSPSRHRDQNSPHV
jgi:hypothetical protein